MIHFDFILTDQESDMLFDGMQVLADEAHAQRVTFVELREEAKKKIRLVEGIIEKMKKSMTPSKENKNG